VVNNDVNSLDKVGIEVNFAADYNDISSDKDVVLAALKGQRFHLINVIFYYQEQQQKGKYECQ